MADRRMTLKYRWKRSVVFRLSAAMIAIAAFVAISQASVGFQIFRVNVTQNSFLETSVPLLNKSQKFARLMTQTLSQTARLDEFLTTEELVLLRLGYYSKEHEANAVLSNMENLFPDEKRSFNFKSDRLEFSKITEKLFENQHQQQLLKRKLQKKKADLVQMMEELEDLTNHMLVKSTTSILSVSIKTSQNEFEELGILNKLLKFAEETETLNVLNGHVAYIANLVQAFGTAERRRMNIGAADRLRFRIKGISQSLALLGNSTDRAELAGIATRLNSALTSGNGYIALILEIAASQKDFDILKSQQIDIVENLDGEVEKIVFAAAAKFRNDIELASRLTDTITWIGLATTGLVIVGILGVHKLVIRRQISDRFTTLTNDARVISKGDYEHVMRIHGEDEFGDIGQALNIFKGKAAELERSNLELEKFAYVAAHDLRSPLDAIQDLAKWTLEDAGDELSETSTHNLELLIKRSARLSALQADLLTYAQAGSVDDAVGSIQLKMEIEKISDMLDPGGSFQIELAEDPGELVCHSTPLRQILINLITNAIKHHDRESGKIRIVFARVGSRLRFKIIDDGPGIEEQFQVKIFELFQTLRSRDKVEGSGLGLALVTKLTGQFGGTVNVQSNAPNTRGTTFTFELTDMAKANIADFAA